MKLDTLMVHGKAYQVKIFYEERQNSSVSIRKKSITIRIPLSMNREEQFRNLLKMKQWAKEKLEKNQPKEERIKEYADGELLKVGDVAYKLSISYAQKQGSSARLQDNVINLYISSELPKDMQNKHISSLLSRILARERMPFLKEKLHSLNEKHFKQEINKIFFKNLRSRWGSCSGDGNINISTRLLFAPDDILECVCIHELAHIIEHNHSDNFWALVEKAMPDYEEKQKWLKENGHTLGF